MDSQLKELLHKLGILFWIAGGFIIVEIFFNKFLRWVKKRRKNKN
jgi:hypothetical protein